jgi:hypothetical protein
MSVYEVLEEYVHSKMNEINAGSEVILEVRDTDTFERLTVKAVIAQPGQELEDADDLVLRNLAENIAAEGWHIKIIEELDPEDVNITPESDFRRSAPDGA